VTPEQRWAALKILDAADRQVFDKAAQAWAEQPTFAVLEHWAGEVVEQLAEIQAARVAVLQGGAAAAVSPPEETKSEDTNDEGNTP